jgi:hypothetical protein
LPDAVHDVAPVTDHARTLEPPDATEPGVEVKVIAGEPETMRVALHCAVVPPLLPPHDQVYVLVFVVTDEAVPTPQRFIVGAVENVPPLLVPHTPLTGAEETVTVTL